MSFALRTRCARTTLVALTTIAAALLASSGHAGYVARLWFENLTKGTSNAGALLCDPGDQIAIKYYFMADDQTGNTEKWGTMQITLILDGKTIISDAQANTWATQVNSVLTPGTWFPVKIFWQPDYGEMRDNAVDPSDPSYPFVANKGLYALIGVAGNRSASWNFNKTLFTFTIAPGSEGQTLNWAFDNRDTGTGLSTRILDYRGASVDVTDNWIQVSGGGGPTDTNTTVVAVPNPSVVGQNVVFTATVSPTPDGGTVQFKEDGANLGAPVPVVGGQASTSKTYTTAGSRNIEAVYSGTANFNPSSGSTMLVVNKANTTTTVVANPNPVDRGNNSTLTATISPTPDGGTVQFKENGVNLGAPVAVVGGQAQTTQQFNTAGNRTITAEYSGTANYNGSTGQTTLVVNKTPTTTTVVANPNPVDRGSNSTLTATISPSPDGGTVQFKDNGVNIGAPVAVVAGQAQLTQQFNNAGTRTITAEYSGTTNYAASNGTTQLTVNKTPTSTSVATSPNPSNVGQIVQITATVAPTPDGGNVQFKVNGVNIGAPVNVVAGQAQTTYAFPAVGVQTVEAVYSGNANFEGSAGSTQHTVQKTPTTTNVVAAPNPARVGQLVTFTATVSPTPDGGTVQFKEDGVNLGAPVAVVAGQASTTKTYATVGNRNIEAVYSGTSNFDGSTDSTTLVVNKALTTTVVVANPNPVDRGSNSTLTATISPTPDGGTVQFKENGVNIGAPVSVVGGQAQLNQTFNTGGNRTIRAEYSGTANYESSAGETTLVVNPTPTTTTVVANPNPVDRGSNSLLTATISPTPDGGTVQFKENGVNIGAPVSVVGGQAQLNQTFNTAGNRTIEAVYSGTTNFRTSTGSTTLVVNKTPTTTTVATSPNPSNVGQNVQITATVAPTPDGGSVQFKVNGVNIGAPVNVVAGQAQTNYAFPAEGVQTVEAVYSGNTNFAGSTGSTEHTVEGAAAGLSNIVCGPSVNDPFSGLPVRIFRPQVLNIDSITLRDVLRANQVEINNRLIVQAVRIKKVTPSWKCTAFVTGPGSGLNTNFDTGLKFANNQKIDDPICNVAFQLPPDGPCLGNRALLFSPPETLYELTVVYVVLDDNGRPGPPQYAKVEFKLGIADREKIKCLIEYFSTVAVGATQKPKISEECRDALYDALDIQEDLEALIQFETVIALCAVDFPRFLAKDTEGKYNVLWFRNYLIDSDEEPVGCLLIEMANALLWK